MQLELRVRTILQHRVPSDLFWGILSACSREDRPAKIKTPTLVARVQRTVLPVAIHLHTPVLTYPQRLT
jgi:hypothetical protein